MYLKAPGAFKPLEALKVKNAGGGAPRCHRHGERCEWCDLPPGLGRGERRPGSRGGLGARVHCETTNVCNSLASITDPGVQAYPEVSGEQC